MPTKKIKVTNVYRRTKSASQNKDLHTIVNKGGAGSSKSFSMIQFFTFERLLKIPGFKLLVLRKTRKSLKLSLYREWMKFLKSIGIYEKAHNNKTDLSYEFPNGSYILFGGLDNEEKIKSTEWHDILLEEANEFSERNYHFLSTRKFRGELNEEHKPRIFMNLNPINCWIKDKENAEGWEFIHSTVDDNPFANEEYKETLDKLKSQDRVYYEIYREGKWAVPSNIIYDPYEIIDEFPGFEDVIYGIDFGFNAPSAVVKIGIKDEELYEDGILYETGLTNSELIEKIKDKVDSRQLNKNWYADSAEPDRIKEFRQAGFNIRASKKGKNSVVDGIDYVKRFKRHTTKDNTKLIEENKQYKWKEDRDGNILDEPVKFKDHYKDAERYAIHNHFRGRLNMPSVSEMLDDINSMPDRETTQENVI